MTQSIPARTAEEQARIAKLQQMTPDKRPDGGVSRLRRSP
jgi:hypothetical protein